MKYVSINIILLFSILVALFHSSVLFASPRIENFIFNSDNINIAQSEKTQEIDKIQTSPYHGAKKNEKRSINISLDNMDIYPVLDLVLTQILNINYVIDPTIRGTMSFKIIGDYTRDELLEIFNSVLQFHGLSITKGNNDIYRIVRKSDSPRFTKEITKSEHHIPSDTDVISVIKLKYISAAHLANNLRNFVSPSALLIPEVSINAIILVDNKEIIEKISSIINLLDNDFFTDYTWKIFELKNTKVDDVAKDLEKILQNKTLYARPGIDTHALQVIPLKSINAILVITKWQDFLNNIETWIKEFDKEIPTAGPRVYVYFVQNGNAVDLADILSRVFLGRSIGKTTKKQTVVRQTRTTLDQRTNQPQQRQQQAQQPTPQFTTQQTQSSDLLEDVEIIPDEINNAIIIKAKPKDYNTIMEVLKQLDRLPRQVLIEVLILDVVIKDELQYGVEWFLKNKGIKLDNNKLNADISFSEGISINENTPLGKGIPGLSYAVFNTKGSLRALIRTLAEKTDINVLSAPNILAVDNQEATIEITTEVPVLGSITNLNTETPLQSIDYKNAGIILTVKPSINNSGIVRMEVTQEVSEPISESIAGINSPIFRTRKATTNIVAKDGETVIIGGLMQNKKSSESDGIPLLKDLPLVGLAFGSKKKSHEKTELIFALTPHVIHNTDQIQALTTELSQNIEELKREIERQRKLHKTISDKKDETN